MLALPLFLMLLLPAQDLPPSKLDQAIALYIGTEGVVDYPKARALFEAAAESGEPLAVMWLARCIFAGRAGFPVQPEKGRELALSAVDRVKEMADQNAEAAFLYGSYLDEGMGDGNPDPGAAVPWYEKAAEAGHAGALNNLGVIYLQGLGRPMDREKAMSYYTQSGQLGNMGALNNLAALLVEDGKEREAVTWFEKGAAANYAPAMVNLADIYMGGREVPLDIDKAVGLYRTAVALGELRANVALGVIYANGNGVTQDRDKARELLQPAADAGNGPALFHLALLDLDDTGSVRDEVIGLLEQAAEAGHGAAAYRLGKIFEERTGTEQALSWYRRGAELQHPASANRLGLFHITGRTLRRDLDRAAELFRQAAEAGHGEACNNLGRCYLLGAGVPRDPEQAQYWFNQASQRGYPANSLDDYAAVTADWQISQGFARNWIVGAGFLVLALILVGVVLVRRQKD